MQSIAARLNYGSKFAVGDARADRDAPVEPPGKIQRVVERLCVLDTLSDIQHRMVSRDALVGSLSNRRHPTIGVGGGSWPLFKGLPMEPFGFTAP